MLVTSVPLEFLCLHVCLISLCDIPKTPQPEKPKEQKLISLSTRDWEAGEQGAGFFGHGEGYSWLTEGGFLPAFSYSKIRDNFLPFSSQKVINPTHEGSSHNQRPHC